MEQNKNDYMTLELNLKFQMKDYRIALGIKRAWVIAVILGLVRLAVWYFGGRQ